MASRRLGIGLERYRKLRTQPEPGRRGTGQTTCNREMTLLSAVIDRCKDWGLHDPPGQPV